MKTYDRVAQQVKVIQSLMEKFPREVYPAHDLNNFAWYGNLDLLPSLQQTFTAREAANPSDPVAIYFSAYSRFWDDAPEAMRKFQRARDIVPDFPWPYLALAGLSGRGKTRNLTALSENIAAFFNLCPSSTDDEAQRWLERRREPRSHDKGCHSYTHAPSRRNRSGRLETYETLRVFDVSSPSANRARNASTMGGR